MTITMKFTPNAPGGASATLIVTSDADIPTNQLSVTGSTTSSGTNYYPTFPPSKSSDGSNCFIGTIIESHAATQ